MGNGGIGRVVSILSNSFIHTHQLYMVVMDKWDRDKFVYKLPEEVEGVGWNSPPSMVKILLHGGIGRLRRFLKENEIDIVIGCGALYFPLVVLASNGTNARNVCWEHSNANNKKDHKFQMQSRFFGAKFGDSVVTITKQDYEIYLRKYNPKLLKQIYNPIDPELEKNACIKDGTKHRKRILSVGRLCYQKNYPALVDVAKNLMPKHFDWTWDIYGGGGDGTRKEIENLINENNLREQVFLKGQVPDMYERYKDYDFLVMTSHYEGFGMVLLEALASGLPIIAFDVECGPREVIDNGRNGYLVEAFDTIGMSEKLESLMDDYSLVLSMSQNARKKIREFHIDKSTAKWEKLFRLLYVKKRKTR